MDEKPFPINENTVIEKYEWYQNGEKISGEETKYLPFYGINQEANNGRYKCNITLKNGQKIESGSFNLIVYKCKYFLLFSVIFSFKMLNFN